MNKTRKFKTKKFEKKQLDFLKKGCGINKREKRRFNKNWKF